MSRCLLILQPHLRGTMSMFPLWDYRPSFVFQLTLIAFPKPKEIMQEEAKYTNFIFPLLKVKQIHVCNENKHSKIKDLSGRLVLPSGQLVNMDLCLL